MLALVLSLCRGPWRVSYCHLANDAASTYRVIQNHIDDWVPADGALGTEERKCRNCWCDFISGHLDEADNGIGKPEDQCFKAFFLFRCSISGK